MKYHKKHSGFTLIELIVVISIIGILTAVITPSYLHFVNQAKYSADQVEMKEIVKSIELANIQHSISTSIDGKNVEIQVAITSNQLTILVNPEGSSLSFIDVINAIYKAKTTQDLDTEQMDIGYDSDPLDENFTFETLYYRKQNEQFITYNFLTGELSSTNLNPQAVF